MTVTDTVSSVLGYSRNKKIQLCVTKEVLFPAQIYWRRQAEIPSLDKLSGKLIRSVDTYTESLTESRLFLNTLNSGRQPGKANGKESKRSKWEKEDSISLCKYRRNNIQRHSYVFTKCVLDYENECYGLQFQCEHCGDEVSDKVNDEGKENFDGWKQTGMSEVVARYCKKQLPCIHKISCRRGLFVLGKEKRG